MRNMRLTKIVRDLWLMRGRSAMMVLAIAAGLFGTGTILTSYALLSRELGRAYRSTAPASATLELDSVTPALVEAVRARPEIAAAEARATYVARVQVGPQAWRRLLLFVVPDFDAMQLSTVRPVAGDWPPAEGTMLLERSSFRVLPAETGDTVTVKLPDGTVHQIGLAGAVYDAALAPAWQEQAVYGYITPATLAQLDAGHGLDELKIVVRDRPLDAAAIERSARALAAWLATQGSTVSQIHIPPPGAHPHQGQMNALMGMLLLFSLLALGLSAILVATMINALLAQQIRQIGVLKTLGASDRQVAALYLGMVLLLSVMALLLTLLPSVQAGQGFAAMAAAELNTDLADPTIPAWVYLAQGTAALLIPALVALGPITRAGRLTVREALSDYGVRAETLGRGMDRLLTRLRGLSQTLRMALRNMFRRRARLLLTLGLLAAGGALFIAGLSVNNAWYQVLAEAADRRDYAVEVRLAEPAEAAPLLARLAAVPGVATVEVWNSTEAAQDRPAALEVVRTYPDRGHGSLLVRGAPPDTGLVQFAVADGRWLAAGDADAVVLNQGALGQFPGVAVGDRIRLTSAGVTSAWRLVGVVREVGTPAAAYISTAAFERTFGRAGMTNNLRVAALAGADTATVVQAVARELDGAGVAVDRVLGEGELRLALNEHLHILIGALLAMAVLMGAVGMLGLAAALSTGVAERTREFGVLLTLGGTPGTIVRVVMGEGLATGLLSWLVAVVLSLPLSVGVGALLSSMFFRVPLPLTLSAPAVLTWLAVVAVGAIAASALPAWRAAQLTIRETLAAV